MELLPLEALNIIAENRTLYVLAVSSTVNVSWKGFFKQNRMWWPQCNADTAEYLETAECRVDLRFESLESEDSTQTKTIMDLLPMELLNKIGENQTLYMLAASSTVSGGWRGCFNHKWMWWQHCNADTAEYLEAAECRVEPRFESLESEDSTLTCLYKKPHCNADTAEFLETAECRVDSRFESPESEESTLTCLYKKAGDKQLSKRITVGGLKAKHIALEITQEIGIELLPLEALNIIAENRTLYVLAVSSTVNVSWKGFFKQNRMWWPQCNADTAEYLETAECRVDLRFESQESEDSTQTSLYKKAGYKEIFIRESL
ncbi:hypothetical protein J6590_083177 [Homalodisca vitripennis]|nr:hypothetical protein J6590_083177 [Homalodisca vitripennis]